MAHFVHEEQKRARLGRNSKSASVKQWVLRTGRTRLAVDPEKGGAETIVASIIDYSGGEFFPDKSALVRPIVLLYFVTVVRMWNHLSPI